jgi:predicted ABC-type ATPase
MFAGPNGSGKSCFNRIVNPEWLGVYVNADEIEKQLRSGGESLQGDYIREKL